VVGKAAAAAVLDADADELRVRLVEEVAQVGYCVGGDFEGGFAGAEGGFSFWFWRGG
jgi:hypothetical protein